MDNENKTSIDATAALRSAKVDMSKHFGLFGEVTSVTKNADDRACDVTLLLGVKSGNRLLTFTMERDVARAFYVGCRAALVLAPFADDSDEAAGPAAAGQPSPHSDAGQPAEPEPAGLSPEWLLSQLAGMSFPQRGQAYDFMKRAIEAQRGGS